MKIPRWYSCIGIIVFAFSWITPNWLGIVGPTQKDEIRNIVRAPDGKQQKYYTASEAKCLDASNIAFFYVMPVWLLVAIAVFRKRKENEN